MKARYIIWRMIQKMTQNSQGNFKNSFTWNHICSLYHSGDSCWCSKIQWWWPVKMMVMTLLVILIFQLMESNWCQSFSWYVHFFSWHLFDKSNFVAWVISVLKWKRLPYKNVFFSNKYFFHSETNMTTFFVQKKFSEKNELF